MVQATEVAGGPAVRIDGARPFSAETIKEIGAVCDRAEDGGVAGVVTVRVGGAPDGSWTGGLTTALVTKWERVLRRLERLPVATVAVASGDCGGAALDALLATDVRIAGPGTRLLVSSGGAGTWPGMALFRLARQSGAARVRRAVLFGEPIGAAEAVGLGVLDELAADPEAALAAASARFAAFAGQEPAIRRQLLFDAATTSFEDALGAHLAACDRALRFEQGAAS